MQISVPTFKPNKITLEEIKAVNKKLKDLLPCDLPDFNRSFDFSPFINDNKKEPLLDLVEKPPAWTPMWTPDNIIAYRPQYTSVSVGIGYAVLDNRRIMMCDFGDEPTNKPKQILLTTLRKH